MRCDAMRRGGCGNLEARGSEAPRRARDDGPGGGVQIAAPWVPESVYDRGQQAVWHSMIVLGDDPVGVIRAGWQV